MITEEQLKKLIAYIEKNYDASDGARSSLDSEGNSSDVFSDGIDYGKSDALYDVAIIIGLEVEELHEEDISGYGW